jgi:hypothetical protein
MLRFTEKTTPIKTRPNTKLPYIDEALENLAELISNYRNNSSMYRKSYLAIFNALSNHAHLNDKEKKFILDIIQDWDEIEDVIQEGAEIPPLPGGAAGS